MIQSDDTLTGKVVKGGMWIFAMRFVGRGLSVLRLIVLARLLAPEDFGLMGIALLSLAILDTFSQTGFQASLIQKDADVAGHLDTAWTVSVIRGVFLFLLLWLFAPVISTFFNTPGATWIVRVVATSYLLNGCRNIGMVYLDKDLELRKKALFELSIILTNFVVALALAFALKNVWALVWGDVAANSVRLILSYCIHPYKPSLRFEKEKMTDLFTFGRWVYFSTVLIFLVTKGDDLFVGKMLGAAALGYYQIAFMISNLPTTEISHVISSVTFPAYAKLQNDARRLQHAYLKVLTVTTFFTMPFSGLLLVLTSELTTICLGEKWLEIVPVMQVLAVGGLLRAIAATTGPVFYGLGIPAIDSFWQVVRLTILAFAIYPLSIHWGLNGVAFAVLLSISVSTIGFLAMLVYRIKIGVLPLTKILFGPFISAVMLMIIVSGLKMTLDPDSLLVLLAITAAGTTGYLLTGIVYDRLMKTAIIKTIFNDFGGCTGKNTE